MALDSLSRVEKEARRLLDRMEVERAPVDVSAIAEKLGLQVRYEKFERDLSGVLVKTTDGATMGININHPQTRQRFSIAHEIAHYWLRHPGDMFVDPKRGQASVVFRDGRSSDGSNVHEMEANRFAAALIMPAKLVFDSFQKCAETMGSESEKEMLGKLANEFRVSRQAMKIRLSSLGLITTDQD